MLQPQQRLFIWEQLSPQQRCFLQHTQLGPSRTGDNTQTTALQAEGVSKKSLLCLPDYTLRRKEILSIKPIPKCCRAPQLSYHRAAGCTCGAAWSWLPHTHTWQIPPAWPDNVPIFHNQLGIAGSVLQRALSRSEIRLLSPSGACRFSPGYYEPVAAAAMPEICPVLGQVTAICGPSSLPEIFQSFG